MKKRYNMLRSVLMVVFCALIITGISVLFISQMNRTIENNTMNTISELAQHDRVSIQNFLDMKWYELNSMEHRLGNNDFQTLEEVQSYLNLESTASEFRSLYLICGDGSIYTDQYDVYEDGQPDILQYFGTGEEQIVRRYDYTTKDNQQEETLLYAIHMNYTVEDKTFIALAGISNISQIQDNIMISTFIKDGVSRGYSSVVNLNGDYIVNVKKTKNANQKQNFFDFLERGTVDPQWNNDVLEEKMKNKETFSFYYTDEDGMEKLLYFMPIDNTIWYFISVVEEEVFSQQSHAFVFLSMGMLMFIIVIIIILMLFVMISRNKVLKANAEAKARSDFLSKMSHEIRTPLNGIIGLLHLMKTHLTENDAAQMGEWIEKTHDTARYLLSLVSDILDMSKIQAGKLKLAPEPFMVEAMLDNIWSMQHHNIKERGIDFIVEWEITVPCIIGDEVRIKQVLMNIIGNAAKFTPEGGTIKLSTRQEETDANHVTTTITCEDNGIGMSPQFLETIWDSFTQEEGKSTNSIKGTGLGMAISKEFVNAMGGEIYVESEPNKGSIFTVVLHSEISKEIPKRYSKEISSEKADTENRDRPVKLLVADDNEMNAQILFAILTEKGYEVVLEENGKAAVDRFSESAVGEFDIILMDMQMPVLNGCEATSIIRKMDRPDASTIPIFACTANAFQEDKEQALKSGMTDFLTKPIDVDVLFKKLEQGKN